MKHKFTPFSSWTQEDTNVTCRHLGFKNGTFFFGYWAKNDSTYMLYHRPQCLGYEDNIMDCMGSTGIKIGSRICGKRCAIQMSVMKLTDNHLARKSPKISI